jgi:hypothetical protein
LLRDSDAADDIPYELWPSVQNALASAQWDQFDNTRVSIRAVEMLFSVSSERRTGHSHCRVVLSHLVQRCSCKLSSCMSAHRSSLSILHKADLASVHQLYTEDLQWTSERSLIPSILPMYHYTPPFSLSLCQR